MTAISIELLDLRLSFPPSLAVLMISRTKKDIVDEYERKTLLQQTNS